MIAEIDVAALRNSTISHLYAIRNTIDMDPPYQRQGAVWSLHKQQLLIDSILNGFDIPKIYVHQFPTPKEAERARLRYALIDGKQRMEAIWGFIENRFPLSDDFRIIETSDASFAGWTYKELEEKRPDVMSLFNSTSLDVIAIKTDDIELIEEMFSRLNEAVPLNAAEQRNAKGGPGRDGVLRLSSRPFFTEKLPFGNTRYRHFDLAAKFLLWADRTVSLSDVADVKKYYLDAFFDEMRVEKAIDAEAADTRMRLAVERAEAVLSRMEAVFTDQDRELLSRVGMVSVYFLLFAIRDRDQQRLPTRSELREFEVERKKLKFDDDDSLTPGQYQLLEFDRYAQSPNDGTALEWRVSTMNFWLEGGLAAIAENMRR